MATIIVEDGTQVSGANSYVSAADFATYAADRGVTVTGTDAELLITAMDYLEQQNFKGNQLTSTQALQWPRANVVIDGWYVAITAVPQLLVDAQCEVALGIDAGNNPLATVGRSTKQEVVGPISVTYMDGARDLPYLAAAENKLRKLLKQGGISATVIRG
jgi:hypothetical protein